ncbi:MAG: ABC transporter ATP-binding protein [Candidatus Dormibacteraeota bacterium]|nr:ABC transporter ATP-binding protein [Candidatus Dormibacteraeota bacterium]
MTGPATESDHGSSTFAIAARAETATKVFGRDDARVRALDHLSVDFSSGQFTAIMGPSGSGKSTLLHCLAGLDSLTSGDIYVGETRLGGLSDADLTLLRRERIGFIFQGFNLVPTLNARDNITLPLAIAGKQADPRLMEDVVTAIGLTDRLDHRPSELSGGQQQRVAAARALVSRPDIIFADEPTGNLDSRSGAELLGFLRQAVETYRQTIIMVTHDPVAAAHADRVVFIADGRIVDEMTAPTGDRILDVMKHLGS